MPIVRPLRPCAREARAQLARHRAPAPRAARARSPMSWSNVRSRDSETTLRARADAPSCSKRARRRRSRPRFGAEALDEQLLGRARRRAASVVSPSSASRAAVFGPMPGHQPGRRGGEALARLLAREHDEAGRLLGVGGDLRDELVRADARPSRSAASARWISATQPAHRRARRVQAVEVEVGLVEPDDLDVLDVRAHDAHHPRGDLAVGREVGRQEHRLRAQPPRARGGHRRADAVAARLVAGRRDHRARAACRRRRPAARAARGGAAARPRRRRRRRRGARRAGASARSDHGQPNLAPRRPIAAEHRRRHQLAPRGDAELAVDVARVRTHRLDADVQLGGDLGVRAAPAAAAEALRPRGRSAAPAPRASRRPVARSQLQPARGEVDRVEHVARLGDFARQATAPKASICAHSTLDGPLGEQNQSRAGCRAVSCARRPACAGRAPSRIATSGRRERSVLASWAADDVLGDERRAADRPRSARAALARRDRRSVRPLRLSHRPRPRSDRIGSPDQKGDMRIPRFIALLLPEDPPARGDPSVRWRAGHCIVRLAASPGGGSCGDRCIRIMWLSQRGERPPMERDRTGSCE